MKSIRLSLRPLPALFLGLGLGASGAVHAAAFQLIEQNASGLGNAYAGSAAIAENASTIFYNPAGMTLLPGLNVSAGLNMIGPSFKFTDRGSTAGVHSGVPPLGIPSAPAALGASRGGDAGSWAAVPNMYLSYQINPSWFVGLGVGAPFGLATEYSDDWMGRYHSRKFSIETININPSVAWKVNERFSIGLGVNWQHIKADYRRAEPHPIIGQPDIAVRLKMDDNAWGWNLGLLYQATDDTRLGLSYRSRVKQKATGVITQNNTGVALGAALPAGVSSRPGNATIKLPDTVIFSVVHDLNPQWTLLADVSWTGWSSIPSLDIFSNGAEVQKLDLRFRDSWRFALGANYKMNQQWTLKAGIAYDQSPVDKAQYRPTSLPDNDRKWLSLGAQYRFNEATTIDVGYSHLFLSRTPIANDTSPTSGTIVGEYKSNANIIGVQLSHRF